MRLLLALCMAFLAAPALAQNLGDLPIVTTLIKDRDFRELAKPLPTSAGPNGKEVIVFFFYGSPWSAKVAPYIKAWQEEAGPEVRFTWAPAVLADRWGYGARVFYALDSLGKTADLTVKLIAAYDKQVVRYGDTASLEAWLDNQGVKASEFDKALDDGKVVARTTWVPKVMGLYGVQTVPTIVINGRYVVEANSETDPLTMLARARYIVDHAGPAAASP